MSPTILNPLSIMLALSATLGIFVHDTQIYNATKASLLSSSAIAEFKGFEELKLLDSGKHVHSENSVFYGLGYQQPTSQPRNKDDKKYVAVKRLVGNTYGSEYSWPFS